MRAPSCRPAKELTRSRACFCARRLLGNLIGVVAGRRRHHRLVRQLRHRGAVRQAQGRDGHRHRRRHRCAAGRGHRLGRRRAGAICWRSASRAAAPPPSSSAPSCCTASSPARRFSRAPPAWSTRFSPRCSSASSLMCVIGYFAIRPLVKILDFPEAVVSAYVLMLCFIGALSIRNNIVDLWLMLGFGVLGYVFERVGFPVAPLVLGVILGPLAEENFMNSMISFSQRLDGVLHPADLRLDRGVHRAGAAAADVPAHDRQAPGAGVLSFVSADRAAIIPAPVPAFTENACHEIRVRAVSAAQAAALAQRQAARRDDHDQSGILGRHQGHAEAVLSGRPRHRRRRPARQRLRQSELHLARIRPARRRLAHVRHFRRIRRAVDLHA